MFDQTASVYLRLRFLLSILFLTTLVFLPGCSSTEEPAADEFSKPQHFAVALPPELDGVVSAVLFEITHADGTTQSQVVPLVAHPLPASLDPDLAGHRFADWFVVLNPGDYSVVATPLNSDEQPSEICEVAGGRVSVFEGVTTEVILVSNCEGHSGGLDVTLVFNTNPFIEELVISPNKFPCIDEPVALIATVSDAEGDALSYDWQVSGLPAGADATDYVLAVDAVSPWQARFVASVAGRYELTLTVSDGRGRTRLTFPIYVEDCVGGGTASIHGVKWQDTDGNSRRDRNEPGLAGVTVYADLNNNGALDTNEPYTVTMRDDPLTDFDESGLYWLQDLTPGRHTIREIVPDGFIQTFPLIRPVPAADPSSFATLTPAAINRTMAVGDVFDTQVSITIEPLCFRPYEIDVVAPLAPAGMFQQSSGVLLNGCGGDTSTFDIRLTNAGDIIDSFDIEFVDAEFGGVLASIPVQIVDLGTAGSHTVGLNAGDTVEGIDFGNQPIRDTSVHGTKWQDDNRNGRRDRDEPGLAGVTIYVDLNNNGALDTNEPNTVTMADDPLTDFDESGLYWLQDLTPGRHTIREIVPDGFIQTFPFIRPVPAADPSSFATLTPAAINRTMAVGDVFDTQVSITIEPLCIRPYDIDVVAPSAPAGMFQQSSGVLFNGCGGDTSTFDIRLTNAGDIIDSFDIEFVDAEFGGVLASIPVQIVDLGTSGSHTVDLNAGDTVEGLDFGNAAVIP